MDYNKVKEWVSNSIIKGVPDYEIRTYLLSLNYPKEVVDKIISECQTEITARKNIPEPKKAFKISSKVWILVVLAIVACVSVTFIFFFNPWQGKIETAELKEDYFTLTPGRNETFSLLVSGKGEAMITVQNITDWVVVTNNVSLSKSSEEIPIFLSIPNNLTPGKYFGSIIVRVGRSSVELPFSIYVTSCLRGDTKACNDQHGCSGVQLCLNGTWDQCISNQNWCDEDCDGVNETCKDGDCNRCQGHIYYAFNYVCAPCRYLAYNLVEDVVGTGAPHSSVKLELWTDQVDSFINPYVEKLYSNYTSDHWAEIKTEWKNKGIPESAFPHKLSSWVSDNVDILNAVSHYICVCDPRNSCYCDELAGRQPKNNGCIDTNPGCGHETEQCGTTVCTEEQQIDVENALVNLGIKS